MSLILQTVEVVLPRDVQSGANMEEEGGGERGYLRTQVCHSLIQGDAQPSRQVLRAIGTAIQKTYASIHRLHKGQYFAFTYRDRSL